MKSLEQLKSKILKDGYIDDIEVGELETAILADGKIDEKEADILFELNDALSGKMDSPSWTNFFVQVISSFVLHNEESKIEIDHKGAEYLLNKITGDGKIDPNEKALLINLRRIVGKLPDILNDLVPR